MPPSKANKRLSTLDKLLGEVSWLLSHAQALSDYGRTEEAKAELVKAAHCEEEVAFLLDAAGRQQEAALHRASAAACHEALSNYPQAVTLLWAALAGEITDAYRLQLEKQIERCIARAKSPKFLPNQE